LPHDALGDLKNDGSLLVEAGWVAEFVPVPDRCTGKFAGVTGSWIMNDPFTVLDPAWSFFWELTGRIVLC
jgi:hypothetical protein